MSAPLTAPVEAPTVPADNAVHVVCCNPEVAICGAAVPGDNWVDTDDDIDCPLCAIADAEDLPCGAPECWGVDQ